MKKNKNLFKIVSVLLLAFVITLSTGLNSVSVSANTPYRTYTNDGNTDSVPCTKDTHKIRQ